MLQQPTPVRFKPTCGAIRVTVRMCGLLSSLSVSGQLSSLSVFDEFHGAARARMISRPPTLDVQRGTQRGLSPCRGQGVLSVGVLELGVQHGANQAGEDEATAVGHGARSGLAHSHELLALTQVVIGRQRARSRVLWSSTRPWPPHLSRFQQVVAGLVV